MPFGPIANLLMQFLFFINVILVPVLFGLAFIMFLWGVFLYFFNSGEKASESRKKGRDFILYGIIGFFVMVSVWGLVGLLVNSFGLQPGNNRGTPMFIPPGSRGTNPFQNGTQQGQNDPGGGGPVTPVTNQPVQGGYCDEPSLPCLGAQQCINNTCVSSFE